jgi:DNA processing protein
MRSRSSDRLLLAFWLRSAQERFQGEKSSFGLESQGKVLRSLRSVGELSRASGAELIAIGPLGPSLQAFLEDDHANQMMDHAELEVQRHVDAEINMVALGDSSYPRALATLNTAPPILFWRGSLEQAHGPIAAVVGTREPTFHGKEIARYTTRYLVQNGIGIVSGLALGIDAEAHSVAIEEGGYTVAVLAQAPVIATVSPARNRGLAAAILESGGALVSEHPLGAALEKYSFAQRDRIQSGLSNIVVAVQTGESGGTHNTIQFAISQKREVWMPAPGQIVSTEGNEKWAGNLTWIRSGKVREFGPDSLTKIVSAAKTFHPPLW